MSLKDTLLRAIPFLSKGPRIGDLPGIPREMIMEKGGRGRIPDGILAGLFVRNGLVEPMVSPVDLWRAYVNNWMIQAAVDKLVSEAVKNITSVRDCFTEKFVKRCDVCDIDYDEEPEGGVCEECKGQTRDPDRSQLRPILEILEKPTTDNLGFVVKTFKDIIRELLTYELTVGDGYLEVLFSPDGKPAQFWPLASEFVRMVEPGKELKFCDYCFVKGTIKFDRGIIRYGKRAPGLFGMDDPQAKKGKCPKHPSMDLKVAKWVQTDSANNIVAMWEDKEILQFGTRAFGSRPYSVPKMYSVWYIAQILRYQELYQVSSYSMNRMPQGALTFPGMSQERVNQMFEEVA